MGKDMWQVALLNLPEKRARTFFAIVLALAAMFAGAAVCLSAVISDGNIKLTSSDAFVGANGAPILVIGFDARTNATDTLKSVGVSFKRTGGSASTASLAPLSTDADSSGIGIYLENGDADVPMIATSVEWSSSSSLGGDSAIASDTAIFRFASNTELPTAQVASYSYYIVARTSSAFSDSGATPDQFSIGVSTGSIQTSDTAFNSGAAISDNIVADNTPPQTVIEAKSTDIGNADVGSGTWSKHNIKLKIGSCNDAGSGCGSAKYCKADADNCDADAGNSYASDFNTDCTVGNVCDHYYRFRQRDKTGNAENAKSYHARIDMAAPRNPASASTIPGGASVTSGDWTKYDVAVDLGNCSDNGSGCSGTDFCQGDISGCSLPLTYSYAAPIQFSSCPANSACVYSVSHKTRDAVGNEEATEPFVVKIDKKPPTTTNTVTPTPGGTSYSPSGWTGNDVTWSLMPSDEHSGMTGGSAKTLSCVRNDEPGCEPADSGTVVRSSCPEGQECQVSGYYYSTDYADNSEAMTAISAKVDKKKPDVAVSYTRPSTSTVKIGYYTRDTNPDKWTIYYRTKGGNGPRRIITTGNGDAGSGYNTPDYWPAITDWDVTGLAGTYTVYIESTDYFSRTATKSVVVNIQATGTKELLFATMSAGDWGIFSIPGKPFATDPRHPGGEDDSVDLSTYFTFMRWNPEATNETFYGLYNQNFALTPGTAFWMRRNTGDIPIASLQYGYKLESTSEESVVTIHEGWNMISVPYTMERSAEQKFYKRDVKVRIGNDERFLDNSGGWTGGRLNEYKPDATDGPWVASDHFAPGTGYFLYCYVPQAELVFDLDNTTFDRVAQKTLAKHDIVKVCFSATNVAGLKSGKKCAAINPSASDGVDSLDEEEPPHVWPYLSMSFAPANNDGRAPLMSADYRSTGDAEHIWRMEIETDDPGEATIKAEVETPNENCAISLKNEATGAVVELSTITFQPDSEGKGRFLLTIVCNNEDLTVGKDMPAGWSIVSFPVDAASRPAAKTVPGAHVFQLHDNRMYFPDMSDSKANIETGAGYWIWMDAPGRIEAKGSAVRPPVVVPLTKGWNIVGNPFDSPLALSAASIINGEKTIGWDEAASLGLVSPMIFNYENGSHVLKDSRDVMGPWEGRIIKVIADNLSIVIDKSGEMK